ANSDLIVKGPGIVIPHLLQPVETKAGFRGKVRGAGTGTHLVGKIANTDEHEGHGITVRLHKLQIVTSVPPSPRGIDHGARRGKVSGEPAILVHVGSQVDTGRLVVKMSRCRAQRRGDEICTITFVLVKKQRIGEWG